MRWTIALALLVAAITLAYDMNILVMAQRQHRAEMLIRNGKPGLWSAIGSTPTPAGATGDLVRRFGEPDVSEPSRLVWTRRVDVAGRSVDDLVATLGERDGIPAWRLAHAPNPATR